jgi:phage-related protein
MDRVAPIVEGWIKSLTPLFNMFADNWNHSWPMMSATLKGVWDEMVGWVQVAWALISGYVKIGLDIMSGNWKQAWEDLKTTLSGVWDGIKGVISGGIETIKGLFSGIYQEMTPDMKKPFDDAWSHISWIFDQIGIKIDGLKQKSDDLKKSANDTKSAFGGSATTGYGTGKAGTNGSGTGQYEQFASGVENFKGGLAYVHAKELLMNLPKGTTVLNPAKTSQFLQPVKFPPSIMGSSATTSQSQYSGNDNNEQAMIALLGSIAADLHTLVQQGKGGNVTMNAHVASNSIDAQKINEIVQRLGGYGYESVSRGAF